MTAVPWNLICVGLSLACAVAAATLGHSGRMPRYVAVPLVLAFVATGGLALLFAGAVFEWIYGVYLETWPLAALPVLMLADAAALYFLVALWAGTSTAHWFWRWVAVLASLVPLIAVEMIEPLLMLLAGMAPVMLAGTWWNRSPSDKRNRSTSAANEQSFPQRAKWRFRLQSLLLSFVIVGLAAAILRGIIHANLYVRWIGLAAEAILFAGLGLTTSAVSATTWKHRLWLVPLWCTAVAVAVHWHYDNLPDWAGWSHVIRVQRMTDESLGLVILGILTFIAIVAGAVRLASAARNAACGTLRHRIAQGALVATILIVIAPLVRVYRGLLPPSSEDKRSALIGKPPVDNSATFEQLVSRNWGLRWPWEARPGDRFDAKLLVAAEILKTPDRIWVDPAVYTRMKLADGEDRDLQTLLVLYHHFDRALWIAASEGKFDRVQIYARSQLRIAALLSSSNLPEHTQTAHSLHHLATCNYLGLHECFSSDEMKGALNDSEEMITRQPSTPYQVAVTADLQRRSETWRERFERKVLELAMPRVALQNNSPNVDEILKRNRHLRADGEGLRLRIALELFRRQHGRWPEHLNELTPEILQEVPGDPFAAQPQSLVYRSIAGGFDLYSVGPDGIDNGGNFGDQFDWNKPGYDIELQFHPLGDTDWFPWRKLKPAQPSDGASQR